MRAMHRWREWQTYAYDVFRHDLGRMAMGMRMIGIPEAVLAVLGNTHEAGWKLAETVKAWSECAGMGEVCHNIRHPTQLL